MAQNKRSVFEMFKPGKGGQKLAPPKSRPLRSLASGSDQGTSVKPITNSKLESFLEKDDLALSGRAQLISLISMKERIGEGWNSVKGRLATAFESSLESSCSPNDNLFKRSDEEYIAIFSTQTAEDKSPEDLSDLCRNLMAEVARKFLGELEPDPDVARAIYGLKDGEYIFDREVREGSAKKGAEKKKTEGKPQGKDAGVSELFVSDERFDLVYRPNWSVRHETVTTYSVHAIARDVKGNCRYDYNVLKDKTALECLIGLDWLLLADAIETMEGLYFNNFRTVYSIPVHYETLFSTERVKGFLTRCRKIPEELRKYVIFTLAGVPDGIPVTKLQMIVSSLKPYCNSVQLECNSLPRDCSKYVMPGLKYLKYRLPDAASPDKNFWIKVAEFSISCKKHKLLSVLSNVNSIEQLMITREIGVNFLSGDIIGNYCEIPEHMQKIKWQELVNNAQF
ncbi:hypothetical protein [Emcibacter sp.]|uniref:hypothetical protein n=1 Tax=Emcibacter sp. TaxID=1979954 RepID=UPI002AA77895|nr:hypothetical protein [Emcibacter sp.]